tara:strand:- start:2 stop:268 length:267 start_codon:yes stop_codon:yes gene_type:complete
LKQSRKRSRKPKTHKKSKAPKAQRVRSKGKTKKSQGKQGKKGKRSKKMNPYMAALQKARKSGAESFTYGGNTYKRKNSEKGGLTLYSK